MSPVRPGPRTRVIFALAALAALGAAPRTAVAAGGDEGSGRSLYLRSNFAHYFGEAGGGGGGLGLRQLLSDRFFVQADAGYLFLAGNVAQLRLGIGAQRPGRWSPAFTVVASALFGDSVRVIDARHLAPVDGPIGTIGVSVAPLRFARAGGSISFFEVGFALGSDWPGLGRSLEVTAVELAIRL